MSLNPSTVGDNTQKPGVSAVVYKPDQLIADSRNLVSQPILVVAGNFKRGTVMGMQSVNALVAVAVAANHGNGTVGSLSTGSQNTGLYVLTATDANTFAVVSPDGEALGNAVVGTPFVSPEIRVTVTAGATPFQAGDVFHVTAYDATGLYVPCVRTAVDGSAEPSAILADDFNSTIPATAGSYVAGEFNLNAMTYDASWTPSLLTAALRKYSLFAKGAISAAAPRNNSAP